MTAKKTTELRDSGFVALRTPLLAFDELEAWGGGLRAASAGEDEDDLVAALSMDRKTLRRRLARLLDRPEVREALFVASPALNRGIEAWRENPGSKKGERAEQALVRYLLRMTARATPFGLFSGCSLGDVGSTTRLELDERAANRRSTRLDMDYLFALTQELDRQPEVRRRLRYVPNSSMYRAAGRLRYVEARVDGQQRSHHLVAVEENEPLDNVLRRAESAATLDELRRLLVADGFAADEAESFLHELVDCQLLVSELSPNVTGDEPIHGLVRRLEDIGLGTVPAVLRDVRDRLAAADQAGLGVASDVYLATADRLRELPPIVELKHLFQVDMVKAARQLRIGRKVVDEVRRGVELLHGLAPRADGGPLGQFCEAFVHRWGEGREVPLATALDDEIGIGFGSSSAESSPLLDPLAWPALGPQGAGQGASRGRKASAVLARKVEAALSAGSGQVDLTDEDVESLQQAEPPPLPDALQALALVAASSCEAIDQGDFQVFVKGAHGPSGARLLGRFCHADDDLAERVEAHLRREETHDPEAIFAEVVHLPEGRVGNILCRPVLREYEIPFLGRGGAPKDRQIGLDDLRVNVSGGRAVLRSARLGQRVVPRLTSAHNYGQGKCLNVYRFLCALQDQGRASSASWSWGGLEVFPFLPRVVHGRLVLARARWRVSRYEIEALDRKSDAGRFRAVGRWREERRLPRRVVLVDRDNELLVDLENVLDVETFLSLVRRRDQFVLCEHFPAADQLCAHSPEGRFVHELVVPFGRSATTSEPRPGAAVQTFGASPIVRSFPPGSEWLYAKLYAGTATTDRLLQEVVSPLARRLGPQAGGWFFLRYADPEWHLRLRFRGEPAWLLGEVLPALRESVQPWLTSHGVWRLQLDTYEREVERYGGPNGIELAERLAEIDSECVLDLLPFLDRDDSTTRWRATLLGVHRLIDDLGCDPEAKSELLAHLARSYASEFATLGHRGFRRQISRRFRSESPILEPLLDPADVERGAPIQPVLAAFDRRRQRLRPVVDEIRRLSASGRLSKAFPELAASFVHMFTNRLLRSEGRAHELVIYDLLQRLDTSRRARAQQARRQKDSRNAGEVEDDRQPVLEAVA